MNNHKYQLKMRLQKVLHGSDREMHWQTTSDLLQKARITLRAAAASKAVYRRLEMTLNLDMVYTSISHAIRKGKLV